MTATEARDYLKTAVQTEVGRDVLVSLGWESIIPQPDRGDDESTVKVAEAVRAEIQRRYGL